MITITISDNSKYYYDSNKLLIWKIKDEGVAIGEFVGLKPKIHSLLVGNNEHKKQKEWVKMLLQQWVIMNINKDVLKV